MTVTTIDCEYVGLPRVAAAFLLTEGDRAAFVETNTNDAVPRLLGALSVKGQSPEQVDWIIVTHVHLDHAGGASALMKACPNATLLCHPKAHKHLIDPSKLVASSEEVYGKERFAELYGTIEGVDPDRVRIMADEETLEWGERTLTFLHTRGHANHHFCIHDSASKGIFTGDSFGIVYPDLQAQGLFAFPTSTPTDFDAAAARQSVARIVGTGAKRAFLTHFGEVRDLEGVAAQLTPQLDVFGSIVDEAYSSELDGDALDAFCDGRVRAHFDGMLQMHGLEGDDVRELLELDTALNAQGLAFAVRKRRFKAGQSKQA